MPIVPVESPTMQTSRPTVLSGPTLLLSRTPLRGTKQPPLEPVLSPCERDHELFGEHYRFAFRDSESSLHARLLICSCPVLLQMLMHIPCIRFSLLLQSTTHLLQPGDLLRLQLDYSRRVCCTAIYLQFASAAREPHTRVLWPTHERGQYCRCRRAVVVEAL